MFKLSIVTPEKIFFEEEVNSLVVPGSDGYLGILANHAPLITALKPGKVEILDADNQQIILAISNGYLEVSKNQATLLCDAAEGASEIDIERAQTAYDKATAQLNKAGDNEKSKIDIQTEKEAQERASNRLRIAKDSN